MRKAITSVLILWCFGASIATAKGIEKWDFGELAMGARVSSKPLWATSYSCDEDGGCELSDAKGIVYFTWDNEVVVKRLFPTSFKGGSLPFGLKENDTEKLAIARIKNYIGTALICSNAVAEERIPNVLRMCTAQVSGKGSDIWLSVYWGPNNRIVKIELYVPHV